MATNQVVVTCLDEAGRWRRAEIQVIGNSNNQDLGDGEVSLQPAAHAAGDGDRPSLEYLDNATDTAPLDSGVVTGGFTDWHVHLHLVDWAALAGSPITRVHDLGGTPSELRTIAARGAAHDPFHPHNLEVLHAGAFLTPPGGYPSDRSWAPASSYREISSVAAAEVAVREMVAAGASAIKVASNSEAGPVFTDAVFTAIVSAAWAAELPVVAHAEGRGEAMRVARLGASRLAHAPFSEILGEEEIAELATRTSWCSTLDIHGWGNYGREHETAVTNVAAFVRRGGQLLYGTDMGNGPTPVGLNARELASLTAAELTPEQQLKALTPRDPRSPNATLLWIPRAVSGQLDVAAARQLTPANLLLLGA